MFGIVNLYLFYGACQDLKKKKITNYYLRVGVVLAFFYQLTRIIQGNFMLHACLLSYVPGVMLLLTAKVSGEKIGFGDGWVFLILANFEGVYEIYSVLQISVFLTVIISFVLLCSKKITKEYQLPFLPFVWIAYTWLGVIGYV